VRKRAAVVVVVVIVAATVLFWPHGASGPLPYRYFRGHSGVLREIAFAPDSRSFATASVDGTVKIWSVPDARLLRVLRHPAGVTSLEFADSRIVTGSYDGIARVWQLSNGRLERTLPKHEGTIWSVAVHGNVVATGGEDAIVRVSRLDTGELLHELRGHQRNVWSLAFSPDGRTLVSGSFDRTVRVWRDGRLLRTLSGHAQAVVAVAYSRDGKLIASGGDDSTVRLWRAADGALLRTLTGSNHVYSVAFSGDSRWLASAGRERGALGTLWKQITGNRLRRWNDPTIRVWSTDDGRLVNALDFHRDDVWSVAISPDNRWLASNSDDGSTALWRLGDVTRESSRDRRRATRTSRDTRTARSRSA
jgi:WD40 repeat protein